MDADTGMILHESNADKPLHPASLTKVMTLLLAFEALEDGRITMQSRIPVSRHAAGMAPSKLDLPVGSSIRVQDAIDALVTKSANDVAVAMAEYLGGSESNFARMMTRRASEIGMRSTVFKNASGLHDPRQVSSARDMALLARFVINTYPAYYKVYSLQSFTYQGHTHRNHNRLMSSYKGMDGMKTGYVQASGFNLVASAVRGDHRLIGVVFGGRSTASRNAHMAQLLDQGFSRVGQLRIAKAENVPVPSKKPGILVAMNTLAPAAGTLPPALKPEAKPEQRWANLNTALEDGKFTELLGEGDFDPAVSKRIETGLIAVSAHKGETALHEALAAQGQKKGLRQDASFHPETATNENKSGNWSVQIGAYKSRAATDKILHNTMSKLQGNFSHATPAIAPLKTKDGWVFRARLAGLSKQDAYDACRKIKPCLPLAPRSK